MPKLMHTLIALLGERHTRHAPVAALRPKPPRPQHLHAPRRPESPLDGDTSPLVRPYLLAHERQQARRERAFLREMAVAS
ncbi:hypothetical protein HEK616_67970 [Streptomyces nigrescens]|uniref:Uncharacterized protein n=1 Tax=Streptomyces nigrescens TaxID=1920 RepID=A0ABM8A484_STRNI|nr:hypothetical protein HEK616_67970 [Streptomyces nigrescens]